VIVEKPLGTTWSQHPAEQRAERILSEKQITVSTPYHVKKPFRTWSMTCGSRVAPMMLFANRTPITFLNGFFTEEWSIR